jgi:regulator of protease activity HflC (stomatin/prohibitin superfamily)
MNNKQFNTLLAVLGTAIVMLASGYMFGMPYYRVWSQEMRGKAALAEAEQDRQIMIEEAKANLEAQRLNAQAEVERAKGMAEAIEIEAGKLTADYIKYLWVRNMEENDNLEKIYIPTEANLPILEARNQNQ